MSMNSEDVVNLIKKSVDQKNEPLVCFQDGETWEFYNHQIRLFW